MKLTNPDILPTPQAQEAAREILSLSADRTFTDQLYVSGPSGDAARLTWQGLHSLAFGQGPQTPTPGTDAAAAASALDELKAMKTKRLADGAYSARFNDVKSVERKRWNELHSVAFATGDAAKH